MSISTIQIQEALREAFRSFLRQGRVPTFAEILKEANRQIRQAGQPRATVDPVRREAVIDDERYNAWWESVKQDLTVAFLDLLEQATQASRTINDTLTTSARLEYLIGETRRQIAEISANQTDPLRIVEDFSSLGHIDYGIDTRYRRPVTDALIDLSQQVATLPPKLGLVHKFDLSEMALAVRLPENGGLTEIPIAGASLENLKDDRQDTVWVTQLLGGGGGAVCQVVLTPPQPVTVDTVEFQALHSEIVEVEATLDGTPVNLGRHRSTAKASIDCVGTLSQLVFTIYQMVGEPSGTKFRYTVGLRQISLLQQEYAETAAVQLLPLDVADEMLVANGGCVGQALLTTEEDRPVGTEVRYEVATKERPEDWRGILPGSPFIVNSRAVRKEVAGGWTPVADEDGTPLFISGSGADDYFDSALEKSFFYREGGRFGVYAGEEQFRVDSYEYDWDWDPDHVPGPDDWASFPPGVETYDVNTIYSTIYDSVEITTLNNGNCAMVVGRNYRWSVDFFCKEAQEVQGLDDLAAVNVTDDVRVTVYLNDRVVPEVAVGVGEDPGHLYHLRPGWNRLRVYIWCRNANLSSPQSHGLNLAPADSSQVPNPNVLYTVASAVPLSIANYFDLRHNTPFLERGRVALVALDSQGFRPVLNWDPRSQYRTGLNGSPKGTVRNVDEGEDCDLVGCYLAPPADAVECSDFRLRATLRRPTNLPTVRPKIRRMVLEVF